MENIYPKSTELQEEEPPPIKKELCREADLIKAEIENNQKIIENLIENLPESWVKKIKETYWSQFGEQADIITQNILQCHEQIDD